MARKKKVFGHAAVNAEAKKGRPVKEFGLKDAVKLVSLPGERWCQSCHGDCKKKINLSAQSVTFDFIPSLILYWLFFYQRF